MVARLIASDPDLRVIRADELVDTICKMIVEEEEGLDVGIFYSGSYASKGGFLAPFKEKLNEMGIKEFEKRTPEVLIWNEGKSRITALPGHGHNLRGIGGKHIFLTMNADDDVVREAVLPLLGPKDVQLTLVDYDSSHLADD
jgi:hypothetical protein